jgi:hypothetical protein
MRPNWRMWLKSRLVWAAISCFVCLYLFGKYAPHIEAMWPWAWPWSGLVAIGFLLLPLLILVCIGAYVLVYHMVGPSLTSFVDKELNKRTAKAKEKYADGLMSFSTAICSATFIAILVFPLTAFMQATTSVTNPVAQMPWVLRLSGIWVLLFDVALFILFWLPLGVATWFRRRALALYDELATLAPADAPVAQGTTKQSTIPDPGPPVYVKANGGSRRRRRHRGT